MAAARPFIAGNWKMYGRGPALPGPAAMVEALAAKPAPARIALFPPFTLIERLARTVKGSVIEVGGQDCAVPPKGPYTGEVSAEMLTDAGATLVLLGHSERRFRYGETDALVAEKAAAAVRAGLSPIICVGETHEERAAGLTLEVISRQVAAFAGPELADCGLTVAYEPVWAIGGDSIPTPDEVEAAHRQIRQTLIAGLGEVGRDTAILYGGSANPGNAKLLLGLDEVGGLLVGRASLKAESLMAILDAAR